jgi:hypothetical protein
LRAGASSALDPGGREVHEAGRVTIRRENEIRATLSVALSKIDRYLICRRNFFWEVIDFSGAQGRNRTTDTAIFSRMLYQLSYLGG